MRVKTETSQIFDFGLTGKEEQNEFNLEKYKELAYGSPRGAALAQIVDERWLQWLQIVDDAPWIRNWHKSLLLADSHRSLPDSGEAVDPSGWLMRGSTPLGRVLVDEELGHQARIAYSIFAESVWGYGVLGWLDRDARGKLKQGAIGTGSRVKSSCALRCIWRLQNVKHPSTTRKYMFDDAIYRGTGLMVPCEFGDLDRWLEPLWFEVCNSSK